MKDGKESTLKREDVFAWMRMKMAQELVRSNRGLTVEEYLSDRVMGRFWLVHYLPDTDFEKLYKRCMSRLTKMAKERGMEYILWH